MNHLLRQRPTTPPPSLGRELARKIELRLSEMCRSGFWQCQNCLGINTREEDDHGQPAYCGTCGSHHITLQPAVVEPEDLYD